MPRKHENSSNLFSQDFMLTNPVQTFLQTRAYDEVQVRSVTTSSELRNRKGNLEQELEHLLFVDTTANSRSSPTH